MFKISGLSIAGLNIAFEVRFKHVAIFAIILNLLICLENINYLHAEIIPATRIISWQGNVGVQGGIPNRTAVYTTISPRGGGLDDTSNIQTALNNCPSGQVVKLTTGTFLLNSDLKISNNNISLRGEGPTQTVLNFRSSGYAHIYVKGNGNYDPPNYIASWTAGYTKGTTVLTLSTVANLTIGKIIALDQLDDNSILVWADGVEGGNWTPSNSDRHLMQFSKVTSISGTQVTIDPPLYMNWNSGLSPRAWWWPSSVEMSGIEDLKIDSENGTSTYNVAFEYANSCWIKNIESNRANKSHTFTFRAKSIEIRDSYFHHTINYASQSYGVDFQYASGCLAENNVFYTVTTPMIFGAGASGNVFGYNYASNMRYDPSSNWLSECMSANHNSHPSMNLIEGNIGTSVYIDNIHGSSSHSTIFRNRWVGWESGRTANAYAATIDAHNRYINMVGNVLGKSGFHNTYENYGGVQSGQPVYMLGYWDTARANDANYDPQVRSTLIRHGNFDFFNNSTVWDPSIADRIIPNSYYLANKPAFFGNLPWPTIGPDVNPIEGTIPAKERYEGRAVSPSDAPVSPKNLTIK
jgi:hypothetical protein